MAVNPDGNLIIVRVAGVARNFQPPKAAHEVLTAIAKKSVGSLLCTSNNLELIGTDQLVKGEYTYVAPVTAVTSTSQPPPTQVHVSTDSKAKNSSTSLEHYSPAPPRLRKLPDPEWTPRCKDWVAHVDDLQNPIAGSGPAELIPVLLILSLKPKFKTVLGFGVHPSKLKRPYTHIRATLAVYYGTTADNIEIQYSEETNAIVAWLVNTKSEPNCIDTNDLEMVEVKLIQTETIAVGTSPQTLVKVIASCVQHVASVPLVNFNLVFAGKVMELDKTLAYYHVFNKDSIHLVPKNN